MGWLLWRPVRVAPSPNRGKACASELDLTILVQLGLLEDSTLPVAVVESLEAQPPSESIDSPHRSAALNSRLRWGGVLRRRPEPEW